MKFILALCLSHLAFSATVCLPKSWILEWHFTPDDYINFALTLNAETIDSFGWIGVGFKLVSDGPGMVGGDIAMIIFPDLPKDTYAESNRLPKPDTEHGGSEDIIEPFYDPAQMKYSWRRKVYSDDIYDKKYVKDAEMQLMWACGLMMGQTQIKHFAGNRDRFTIILSEDFTYGCEGSFLGP